MGFRARLLEPQDNPQRQRHLALPKNGHFRRGAALQRCYAANRGGMWSSFLNQGDAENSVRESRLRRPEARSTTWPLKLES